MRPSMSGTCTTERLLGERKDIPRRGLQRAEPMSVRASIFHQLGRERFSLMTQGGIRLAGVFAPAPKSTLSSSASCPGSNLSKSPFRWKATPSSSACFSLMSFSGRELLEEERDASNWMLLRVEDPAMLYSSGKCIVDIVHSCGSRRCWPHGLWYSACEASKAFRRAVADTFPVNP
jgi:hypothetical protein